MMSFIYCPQCGKELPEHFKFCKYCGSPLSEEMNGNTNEPIPEIMQQQKTNIKSRLLGAYPKLSIAAAVIAVVMVIGVISIAIGNHSGNHNTTDFTASLISEEKTNSGLIGHYQQIYLNDNGTVVNEDAIDLLRAYGRDEDLFDLTVYSDDTARMTTKNGTEIDFTVKDDGFYMSGVYKCPYSYSNGVITVEIPIRNATMKFQKD